MDEKEEIRKIGQRNPLTVLLINELIKGKPGDARTDEDLKKIIGFDTGVGRPGYGYLMSAIKYCESNGIVWNRIPKEKKIICMKPEEVLVRSEGDLRGVRRRTSRAAFRMSTINPESLPQEKRGTALATSAMLGAIAMMSRPQSIKKLASTQATPQIGDALRLFDK